MRTKHLLSTSLVALLVSYGAFAAQSADETTSYVDPLRHASTIEFIRVNLETLIFEEAIEAEEDDDDAGFDWELIDLLAGSLEAADPELLAELEAALGEVEELEEGGEGLQTAVGEANALLDQAYETLVPEDLASDPVFQAAVLTELLVSELGVGEGYEEAAEGELEYYTLAWLTLQRANELWEELRPSIEGNTDAVDRPLTVFNELIAAPTPPERFSDPEDGELAALDVAFGLESAVGGNFIPREFPAMVDTVRLRVIASCAAYEGDQQRLGREHALSAYTFFDDYLERTMGFLNSELADELEDGLANLAEADSAEDAGPVCGELSGTLDEATTFFGG